MMLLHDLDSFMLGKIDCNHEIFVIAKILIQNYAGISFALKFQL